MENVTPVYWLGAIAVPLGTSSKLTVENQRSLGGGNRGLTGIEIPPKTSRLNDEMVVAMMNSLLPHIAT